MGKTPILTIAVAGILACSCSSGADDAALTRQASRIDSVIKADASTNPHFIKSAEAGYSDKRLKINVAFADSAINVRNIAKPIVNYFTAEQLKANADKNLEETVNCLARTEGTMSVEMRDVYENKASFDFTAEELKFLIKSQRSRINFAEAKQNALDLLANASDIYMVDGAISVDFDLITGFATYTVTFPSEKSYANLTVGNLKARYLPTLTKRYAAFGTYEDCIFEMLKSLGIEGYRFVYTAEGESANELKAAIPWREI